MKSKNNYIGKLQEEIHKKTSMVVSKVQLNEFLDNYDKIESKNNFSKSRIILKRGHFVDFTDFMVERTDIKLF